MFGVQYFFPILFKYERLPDVNGFVTRVGKNSARYLIETQRKVDVDVSHEKVEYSIFGYAHFYYFIHGFTHGEHDCAKEGLSEARFKERHLLNGNSMRPGDRCVHF